MPAGFSVISPTSNFANTRKDREIALGRVFVPVRKEPQHLIERGWRRRPTGDQTILKKFRKLRAGRLVNASPKHRQENVRRHRAALTQNQKQPLHLLGIQPGFFEQIQTEHELAETGRNRRGVIQMLRNQLAKFRLGLKRNKKAQTSN